MASPVWPPMIYQQPTPQRVNWTPAAPQPVVTTYIPWNETADQTREEFGITPPFTYPPVSNT